MTKEVKVITFGCRLNIFESEIIRRRAIKSRLFDAVILHTCAITKEAERQARQQLRRIINENPKKKIIITGCSAQNSYENLKDMSGVFAILGNTEKLSQSSYDIIAKAKPSDIPIILVGNVLKNPPPTIDILPDDDLFKFDGKTKAFVQIQQGCNNHCTFCIVPSIRGKNQSFTEQSIINQVKGFISQNYKEVIFTGVDISAYGTETKTQSIFTIAKKILDSFPSLERLRLSSLDPAKSYDQILGLMRINKKLLPFLHLSIQSGDDRVLNDMRRRHTRQEVISLCKKIRKTSKHIMIGADIIVGFPGETDKEFKNTVSLLKKCRISNLHVFPYSKRPNTKAAIMLNQVDEQIKKQRVQILKTLGDKLKTNFIRQEKGRLQRVLIENNNLGYTENYIFVKVEGNKIPTNTIANVKIKKLLKDGTVIAKLIK